MELVRSFDRPRFVVSRIGDAVADPPCCRGEPHPSARTKVVLLLDQFGAVRLRLQCALRDGA